MEVLLSAFDPLIRFMAPGFLEVREEAEKSEQRAHALVEVLGGAVCVTPAPPRHPGGPRVWIDRADGERVEFFGDLGVACSRLHRQTLPTVALRHESSVQDRAYEDLQIADIGLLFTEDGIRAAEGEGGAGFIARLPDDLAGHLIALGADSLDITEQRLHGMLVLAQVGPIEAMLRLLSEVEKSLSVR